MVATFDERLQETLGKSSSEGLRFADVFDVYRSVVILDRGDLKSAYAALGSYLLRELPDPARAAPRPKKGRGKERSFQAAELEVLARLLARRAEKAIQKGGALGKGVASEPVPLSPPQSQDPSDDLYMLVKDLEIAELKAEKERLETENLELQIELADAKVEQELIPVCARELELKNQLLEVAQDKLQVMGAHAGDLKRIARDKA